MKKVLSLLALITMVYITSCKKDKEEVPTPAPNNNSNGNTNNNTPQYGSLEVLLDNVVGTDDLVLDSVDYINADGDTFKVSLYNYYISNVKVMATDGTVFTEGESYHLIQEDTPGSLKFTLSNLPVKSYSSISFVLGVDSARNVSGAQDGALDPANGMFWTWNSGYIMAKLEGSSPQSTASGNALKFHVGGFSGTNNSLKNVYLNFPNNANVTSLVTPKVKIKSDVLEWFKTPNTIDFGTINVVHMPGATAKKIADNYADMFTVSYVQN